MTKLSESALKLLTEGKNVATVATIMPDGSPQSTAVWIDSDGEHVIFNTAEGRVKTENLRRDPRVAITVWDADNPFSQASMRGRVVEMTTEGADAHIDKLAKKYMGVDSYPGRRSDEQRVIVKIEVD
ncbi:MAG: PPOX class F420-dependent oxidoreductase [Chloroflexi bacterium]|nr:PPOX class F420-dependent oxidoreductase [Chloroflexota bacterium]MCH7653395.1 PPOX class F420-dependent oxidoreductase [Chloroflexota bacterium]